MSKDWLSGLHHAHEGTPDRPIRSPTRKKCTGGLARVVTTIGCSGFYKVFALAPGAYVKRRAQRLDMRKWKGEMG